MKISTDENEKSKLLNNKNFAPVEGEENGRLPGGGLPFDEQTNNGTDGGITGDTENRPHGEDEKGQACFSPEELLKKVILLVNEAVKDPDGVCYADADSIELDDVIMFDDEDNLDVINEIENNDKVDLSVILNCVENIINTDETMVIAG